MVKGISKGKEWKYCKKHDCRHCSIIKVEHNDWFKWRPAVNKCKFRKRKEQEHFKNHKCDKCGTQEIGIPGAHWEELMIPSGFYCPKCRFLSYTVWGGFGSGAPEGRVLTEKEIKELLMSYTEVNYDNNNTRTAQEIQS